MADSVPSPVIGVIGGSGVYEIEGLANARWQAVASPFGAPSDELLFGELDGQPMVFAPISGGSHDHATGEPAGDHLILLACGVTAVSGALMINIERAPPPR